MALHAARICPPHLLRPLHATALQLAQSASDAARTAGVRLLGVLLGVAAPASLDALPAGALPQTLRCAVSRRRPPAHAAAALLVERGAWLSLRAADCSARRVLQGVAGMDPSPALRQLAAQMAQLVFGGQ